VVAGLAAAQLERGAIEKDITERAESTLAARGAHWAAVNVSGRDVALFGNATSENEPVEAEAILRGVWGVGNVINNAGLPPKVEPFAWSARRRGGRVRLIGYVPNRAVRQTIIGMTNAALPGLEVVDRMHVARGVPPTDTWLAGLSFALKQLASLRRGEVSLQDLAMTIVGEAEDPAAYRTVSSALKRGLPKGVTLASAEIAAPVVSPYVWSAQFAGGQLVLSGHVTGEGAREALLAAARAAAPGADTVDRMEPAGGAPAAWAEVAVALVKEIVRLPSGSVEMKDATLVVGGVAADEAQAQAVREGLRAAVPAAFKLTDQIRVREPKIETKPAPEAKPETAPPATPVRPDQQTNQQTKEPTPPGTTTGDAEKAQTQIQAKTEATDAPIEAAPKTATAPAALEGSAAACRDDLGKLAGDHPIAFERGSAQIEAAGLEALARIAAAIKACPGVHVAAEGHADVEGITEYNQRLSVRRAQAVADYLVGAGVDAGQVEAIGFGSSRPVAPNSTPDTRAKNRRTEILVRR
jgi:OOP family OmpA-OmpF porin